ncbi:MAG: GRAS family protein [Spirosomataceae bacterium]
MVSSTIRPALALQALASHFPNNLTTEVQAAVSEIYEYCQANLDDADAMLGFILSRAMRKHYTGEQVQEHIYTKRFEIPQIRLFELLIKHLPAATVTQACANTQLVAALAQHESAVLMDIGIGTGVQIKNLLLQLNQYPNCQIKQLTVVGVEPFGEALVAAKQNLDEVASEVAFDISFIAKEAFIEHLTAEELKALLPAENAPLYINTSFTLHHIRLAADRVKAFEAIKALRPEAVVVSEPESDHYEADYAIRFQNCLNHYSLVFDLVDDLAISPQEKAALKLFFSREIDDVLGNSEEVRVEKHYSAKQWLNTFEAANFQLHFNPLTQPVEDPTRLTTLVKQGNYYSTVYNHQVVCNVFWITLN